MQANANASNDVSGRYCMAAGHAARCVKNHHSASTRYAHACNSACPANGHANSSAHAARSIGTIMKLANGTATRFASGAISDACPKNHAVNGSNASVISNGAYPISLRWPRQPASCASVHASNATPANDSQKPADSTDRGSATRIAASATPKPSPKPPPRRRNRHPATTAIISNVRVVGKPNPASAP